jgi:hypothetical protein
LTTPAAGGTMPRDAAPFARYFVKYILLAVLVLALIEAAAQSGMLDPRARVGLSAILVLYGVWAILPFRSSSAVYAATEALPRRLAFALSVTFSTVFHLVFRLMFLFVALAYLAQAAGMYDASIVARDSSRTFISYLLAILDQTFPPISALLQLFFPGWRPVIFNYTSTLTFLLRIITYAIFAIVVASIIRSVWLLGYQYRFEEMNERLQRAQMRGE